MLVYFEGFNTVQIAHALLVYEEYFNAGVSIYISHTTIFTSATVFLKPTFEGSVSIPVFNKVNCVLTSEL